MCIRDRNKYYHVNEIIDVVSIENNGQIKVKLKEGLIIYSNPSKTIAEIQYTDRVKYGNKNKLNKILDVDKFYFLYEVLSELFVEKVHFQYFKPMLDEVIVDCGANIGGFVIQAAKMIGDKGKIIAIEPDEENYNLLQKNIEANGFTNVILVKKGVWDKKDTLTFHIGIRPGEHSIIMHDDIKNQSHIKEVKIDVDTLDNILTEINIKSVNFVKIDIEGAEIQAIKGMESVFTQTGVNWVVEAGHLVNGEMTFNEVESFMKLKGCKILSTQESFRGTIYAMS
mgnify:CR=1 FL=1